MNESPRNPLRILLSAYACEPGKGSEPSVGWNWALALARRGHQVWVLTRRNNQKTIEPECQHLEPAIRDRLHFTYYDLPPWASRWKKGGRGVHLYYLLWQWGAYQLAKRKHGEYGFDLVHHVTFVTARQPSFMGGLGIPFILGPVAGGERAPWRLRSGYSWKGWLLDAVRDAANALVKLDPLMWRTFAQAELIFVTSSQTRDLMPKRYWHKTRIKLAIALDNSEVGETGSVRSTRGTPPRIVYLGRFLYWKGMHLGLVSFAHFLRHHPDARLSMIGGGQDEARWRAIAKQLGIASSIDWVPWMNQEKLADVYREHDVLLFPSLHDSGGMVVLEAMQHGLPVVCLKLGGPGALVDDTCGIAIDTTGKTRQTVTEEMSSTLAVLFDDGSMLAHLSAGAKKRASDLSWNSAAAHVYAGVEPTQSHTATVASAARQPYTALDPRDRVQTVQERNA